MKKIHRFRTLHSLTAHKLRLVVLISLAVLAGGLMASMKVSGQSGNGPQPGLKDPVGGASDYFLHPSHNVAVFRPDNTYTYSPFLMGIWKSDQQLQISQVFERNYPYPQPDYTPDEVVAAAGRIWITDGREQVVYASRYNGRFDGTGLAVAFFTDSVGAQKLLPNLADRLPQSADFIDIAAGDLDRVPDSKGYEHDEVIVAYASPGANNQLGVNVAVLDFTAPTPPNYIAPLPLAVTSVVASHPIDGNAFYDGGYFPAILPVDNVLGVAAGDFDADGLNEIALVHLQDANTMWVTIFRYTNDGQGKRSLKEVSSFQYLSPAGSPFTGTVDLAVGDFDGNGGDELLVGHGEWENADLFIRQSVVFSLFQADASLNLKVPAQRRIYADGSDGRSANAASNNGDLGSRLRVQLSPGMLRYDPANGFDLNRRQFVASWNMPDSTAVPKEFRGTNPPGLFVGAFSISDDLQKIENLAAPLKWQNIPDGLPNQRFSIAAGAYRGNSNDAQFQPWGVTLATWHGNGNYRLSTLNAGVNVVSFAQQQSLAQIPFDGAGRFPVVPFDYEGKSIYLGAPVHLMIEHVVNTDFILQEPPKHAFYDNDPQSRTYGQIVTASRFDETNVELKTSKGTSFSGKSTDSSDWTIGGSTEVSGGFTLKQNLFLVESKINFDASAKLGYDYNQKKESYNSNYSSRTISQTEKTDHDDKLLGRLQTIDIWRYRVHGVAATDPQGASINPFYEVILPGPTLDFNGGGLNFDWYQPRHENGNILSYPQAFTTTFTPDDLGAFRVPCPATPPKGQSCNPDGTLTVMAPMVPASQTFFDGTSGSLSYDYSNETGSGNSFSYSHTLTESLDIKLSFQTKVDDYFDAGTSRGSVDAEFHNSNSWGKSRTSDSTTTSDTGITLSRSSGDSGQAYAFFPVFYTTQDGTIKVTHAVDALGSSSGRNFWAGLYGKKADPALNLPQRFSPAYGPTNALTGWEPNASLTRKHMRGFFLRRPDLNPVTNDYNYLASAPLAGDKVRVEARVYNYSTAIAASNVKARFQVIGYDSNTDSETPMTACPGGVTPQKGRCTIGETTIPVINPLEMKVAAIVWDTTGFGTGQAGVSQDYRVYVVLDPDNTIDETYETEKPDVDYDCKDGSNNPCNPALPKGVDPGQNNEGFGYATVKTSSLSAAPSASLDADVYLSKDSLIARNSTGQIRFNNIPAEINKPLRLGAKVYSDKHQDGMSHLFVYDGDPDKGGKAIAARLVHNVGPKGTSVWFDWIPTRPGQHQLYARVVERFDDPKKGNNAQTMLVNVVPADKATPKLTVSLTPSRLSPADGRFVTVRALINVADATDPEPQVKLEAITSSEAFDAKPDVRDAQFGQDDRSFRLRASTSGRDAAGRIYIVVYSVTDWAGNKTFTKAKVLVPRQ